MNNNLCAGRSIFRRSCHCQGWVSSEEQLPPHRGWDCWQDSGSHQEQQVASQEPVTFRPGRVRQDVGAAWYVLFTQSDVHAHKVSMLGGNKCSKSNEGSLLQTDFVWFWTHCLQQYFGDKLIENYFNRTKSIFILFRHVPCKRFSAPPHTRSRLWCLALPSAKTLGPSARCK